MSNTDIAAGHRVLAINGQSIAQFVDLQRAITVIRGEPGTTVKLTVEDPVRGVKRTVELARAIIDTPPVEVRSLGDRRTAEVTALYVGLGQAYYVTANGDSAGVGRFAGDAWVWEPVDEAAPAVAEAISVLNGEVAPAFGLLPIRVE